MNRKTRDQLNAIKNGLSVCNRGVCLYSAFRRHVCQTGKHLARFAAYEKAHPGYDAYTGDQILIDGNRQGKSGVDHVMAYRQSASRAALCYLWLGRNLYIDFAFFRRDVYCSKGSQAPIWMPICRIGWIFHRRLNASMSINMDFPMFRYRVFEGNYINNEIGKAECD